MERKRSFLSCLVFFLCVWFFLSLCLRLRAHNVQIVLLAQWVRRETLIQCFMTKTWNIQRNPEFDIGIRVRINFIHYMDFVL